MYILYMDESGVPETHPSQTSHYVLCGLAVHEGTWFRLSRLVDDLKAEYARGSPDEIELHASVMRRPYYEQNQVPDFDELGAEARYDAVQAVREERRENVWPTLSGSKRRDERRYFRRSDPFVHLTYDERIEMLDEALDIVGDYGRGVILFAEAIRKAYLNVGAEPVDQAFTQVITRFEAFLQRRRPRSEWGLLAMDHNQSTADRFREMLQRFQREGARWRDIDRVIEAPFFFDSAESAGVQVTDLCAYALRRYLERDEDHRFRRIFPAFDRTGTGLHGLRHYTEPGCPCMICRERGHDA